MYEKRIQILMDAYEKQGKRQADFMTDEDDEWVSSVLFYQEQMKNKVWPNVIHFLFFFKSFVNKLTLGEKKIYCWMVLIHTSPLYCILNMNKFLFQEKDGEIERLRKELNEARIKQVQ